MTETERVERSSSKGRGNLNLAGIPARLVEVSQAGLTGGAAPCFTGYWVRSLVGRREGLKRRLPHRHAHDRRGMKGDRRAMASKADRPKVGRVRAHDSTRRAHGARSRDGRTLMSASEQTLQELIGYRFAQISLLRRALTHASIAESRRASNERMEFLGDAVLGLVCCEMVYEMYPDLLEGEMTKIKSTVVSRQTCAVLARQLGLDGFILLGKGMKIHKVLPQSLSAAILEAVIGAIYLDGGLTPTRTFLRPLLEPVIRRAYSSGHQENFKSVLQQIAQVRFGQSPSYLVLEEKGPDHAKCFELCVEMGGRRFRSCWGPNKKAAEQQAALMALQDLGAAVEDERGEIVVRGLLAEPSGDSDRREESSRVDIRGVERLEDNRLGEARSNEPPLHMTTRPNEP